MDKAIRMKPGDWVEGHKAVYFCLNTAIRGRVVNVSKSGKTVTFKTDNILLRGLGGTNGRAVFTYRPKLDRWLERGTRYTKDTDGLCMLRRAR